MTTFTNIFGVDCNIVTPPDTTTIWRYTSIAKLLPLLYSRTLYFCRVDHFDDRWEGKFPNSIITALQSTSQHLAIDILEHLSLSYFVNCWHESEHESAALWHQYADSGIAIKSTIQRLKKSLSISSHPEIRIGRVIYLDFKEDFLSHSSETMILGAFLKRKSFEHEREVRALVHQLPEGPDIASMKWDLAAKSKSITVDPSQLIESVYISPTSEPWLVAPVKDLLNKFGLNVPVTRSDLYDKRVM